VDTKALAEDRNRAGAVVENFVAMELVKQISWSRSRPTLHHFRDVVGNEVDFVLEAPNGRIAGIEVKCSSDLGARDWRGLETLASVAGRISRRESSYTGQQRLAFGENLLALPIASLWETLSPTHTVRTKNIVITPLQACLKKPPVPPANPVILSKNPKQPRVSDQPVESQGRDGSPSRPIFAAKPPLSPPKQATSSPESWDPYGESLPPWLLRGVLLHLWRGSTSVLARFRFGFLRCIDRKHHAEFRPAEQRRHSISNRPPWFSMVVWTM
jgi:hypothetical protein